MRTSFMLVVQYSVLLLRSIFSSLVAALHLGLIFFISISINILFPFFNQRIMIKIAHDRNKLFNKKVVYLLFFILI